MKIKKFYVWGVGEAKSNLVREGESSRAALEYAKLKKLRKKAGSWIIEIISTEEDLDAATRFDVAVLGYKEVR